MAETRKLWIEGPAGRLGRARELNNHRRRRWQNELRAACTKSVRAPKSDPRAAQWLAESLDVCKALGCTMTMPAFFGKGELDMANAGEIDHVVGVLKEIAPKAEKQGMTIGLENYLSAADNMKLIKRIGSPAVKVYYDVGNSTDKGRDVLKEIPLLGKRICEFHFKDAGFMLGQGRIDFKKVRKALDKIEYSGWIQIEAAAPHGLKQDYPAHYKFLRGIYPEPA